MSSLMARKWFFLDFLERISSLYCLQFLQECNLYPLSRATLSLRPAKGGLAAQPFQSGLGFISRKLISTIFFYEKQLEISLVRSGRQIRLKTRIGAERTRQRSFKPRSEFNFLFRDTAGFQTDLPGSGTPN